MVKKTFTINGKDFKSYAHQYGITATYTPITVLPEKYTMDGTLHDDVLTTKATYTVKLNPVSPAVAKEILTEYRNLSTLTIYDPSTDTDVTINCKAGPASSVVALVRSAGIVYWQLGNLTFIEK